TNSNGAYSTALPYGSYTITEQSPVFVQSCPAAFTLSGPGTVTANTGCAGGQPLDVMVTTASGAARPGFELDYGVHVRNFTPASTGTVTLTLEVDPLLGFISASPAPTSVVAGTITWTAPDFTMTNIFEDRYFFVHLQVPPNPGLIGTVLNATATIATQNTDGDLTNNTAVTGVTVTGSLDPNEKVAMTSSRVSDTEFYIMQDEWIDYTIRFQNTGTDTAFNIQITDTLPVQLDPGSVIMGAASHPYTWNMDLSGTLSVIFNDIQLPDSNVNEGASHGFVSFRIKPRQPLLPGTIIANTANIYFDFNPAVITEPSVLEAEFSTGVQGHEQAHGQLRLLPNPVSDQIRISADGTMDAITILAADGREVMRLSVRSSNTSIDVSGLRAGSYFLVTTLANGSIAREHFIKH
ncbi:MAG TPA: T9SS type A sorting domain-containing protein, partial [Flavobacteriales bacterium]|nr:T9SS type A sorting domain-containing protein [Flavobacteriales bacterium]